MTEWRVYLLHMREAILAIEGYCANGERDEKTFAAVQRKLEILGEAAHRIPSEICAQYPHIPWRKIIAVRNILVHLYDGVSEEDIWLIVTDFLPTLKTEIETILATVYP